MSQLPTSPFPKRATYALFYNVCYNVYIHCMLYYTVCSLYTLYEYTVYTIICITLYSIQYTLLYALHYTVNSMHYYMHYTIQYTVYITKLYPGQRTKNITFCVLCAYFMFHYAYLILFITFIR